MCIESILGSDFEDNTHEGMRTQTWQRKKLDSNSVARDPI